MHQKALYVCESLLGEKYSFLREAEKMRHSNFSGFGLKLTGRADASPWSILNRYPFAMPAMFIGLTALIALSLVALVGMQGVAHAEIRPVNKAERVEKSGAMNVLQFSIAGGIGPAQTNLTQDVVRKAQAAQYDLVLLRLDTPGGLVSSMREIVQELLNSPVPVLVWVGPSGARAASAGVFLVAASSVAGMAPQTTMGAASPVNAGGAEIDSTMQKKVINDLSSLVRTIAGKQNRNVEWYEQAVKESVSITAKEAVSSQVVEIVAVSEIDFLVQAGIMGVPLSGQSVAKAQASLPRPLFAATALLPDKGEVLSRAAGSTPTGVLAKAGVISAPFFGLSEPVGVGAPSAYMVSLSSDVTPDLQSDVKPMGETEKVIQRLYFSKEQIAITQYQPGWRHSFLSWLLDPQVAYLLFLAGIGCLFLEFTHAGAILPGVLGAFCLLLGLYALTILPASAAGILLILLGLVLFVLELTIPSFGLLSVGGTICLFTGSVILFPGGDSSGEAMQLPMSTILPTVVTIGAVMGGAAFVAVRALRKKPASGAESFLGDIAQVRQWDGTKGRVFYQGTTWRARFPSATDAEKGLLPSVKDSFGNSNRPGQPEIATEVAGETSLARSQPVSVLALDGLTLIVLPMTQGKKSS